MSNGTDQQPQLTPLKRAFLAIEELQTRLAAAESARREPIAIVGAGCRLPGGVENLAGLWRLLRDGVDAIGPIPPDRWDVEAFYDPEPGAPGKMSQREGGFLAEVERFDPQFFGIAPREASAMDPQQRLLLEVAWEALEHAGQAPAQLAGSATGVYVGLTTSDYIQVHLKARGLDGLDAYYASGVAQSIASGRLSYVLGLTGPSLTIDTACSSSLVAIHLACQSLRSGETNLALAGGVNLILSPENSITLSKYQMLAPDGRCKFGDARGDGFVRGEGCALVVLKRLADAIADGDRVLAVIQGTAVNQDGASSGLTAPNGPSQEAVLRAALADARVSPHELGYLEAHGTGTALGDPIELQALGAVFGPGRPAETPLVVGSVKTNLGHLEAVAGITGLLKLVLMLQHGQIPASLHFTTPSPHLPWDELPLRVPTALEPWAAEGRRLGGVSSFGFSGTNAHLILAEAPAPMPAAAAPARPLHLLALSAQSEAALAALAARYADHLAATPEVDLADVAYTAGSGRSHFAHRLALPAADLATAADQLAAFARGERVAGLRLGHSERADPPRIAFLFTGQGAQYAGMGRSLYASQPVFRAALDRCAAALVGHLDRPLLALLFAEPGSELARLLDQTAYTQPAMVAVAYALAELWRSWGVEPAALLGHSVGEYAAAIVAGVFSLEDGLALVATRGRLMQGLAAGGAMAAIFAASGAVEQAIAPFGGQVSVAAYNGPEHTVVAGPGAAIQALVDQFSAAGVRAQRLNVSHAFHSSLLDPMLAELERAAGAATLNAPRLRLLSNLTGGPVGAEATRPAYWRRHAREAVRFAQGVEALVRLGCEVFIEIGPHPTLLGMAQAALPPEVGTWLPSLRRGRDEWQQLLESLAGAYTAGVSVDWAGFDQPYARRKLALPTYPFQRERYWVEARRRALTPPRSGDEHPLLGRRLSSPLRQIQFAQELGAGALSYLDDHRVFELTILPAAAFAELGLAAARSALGAAAPALEDLQIHAPFVLRPDELRTLQTILSPQPEGASIEILSQGADGGEWTLHAAATVRAPQHAWSAPAAGDLDDLRERCGAPVSVDEHYRRLRERGLDLGPGLQALAAIWQGEDEALGELRLPASEAAELSRYVLHPALLDACLQLLAVAAPTAEATYLPIAVDSLRVFAAPAVPAFAHVRLLPSAGAGRETLLGSLRLFDQAGRPVGELEGLRLKRSSHASLGRPGFGPPADWLYEVAWRPLPGGSAADPVALELPPPAALGAAAAARLPALDGELGLAHYQGLLPALEGLATDYIVWALDRLAWRPRPGERFTTLELAERLGVVPAQRALLNRLLSILGEDGVLRAVAGGWEAVVTPASAATAGRAAALVARYPAARGDIEITRRCGEGLAEVLRGEADPLQLLFPGGSLATAEALYKESPLARAYTALVAEAVAAALVGLPHGRTLRVLEIGGGTGGATAAVLPRLPAERTSYTFTDISPLFLARARENFGAYPFVAYSTLDIEADPLAQGFTAEGFDLIIAANVIHATADLRHSLANLRGLLAPGGAVLLLEMTAPMRWIDVSFGMTEGWWKFHDRDLRPAYPLLSRDGWLALLATVGLEEPCAIPDPAASAGLDHQQIIIARAPRSAAGTLPPALRNLLIVADAGGVGTALAELIRGRGGRAEVVTRDAALAGPADFDRLVRSGGDGPWGGVVYLWPLDAPALAGGDPVASQAAALGGALQLAQALVRAGSAVRLWLATCGAQAAGGVTVEPAQATVWGLGKSLALEHPELRVVCVDLDPAPGGDRAARLLDELARGDEPLVALRANERLGARLAQTTIGEPAAPAPEGEPVELVIAERGSLDNVSLRPAARRAPGPGEVEIRVAATALNFKDVLNLLGMYPGDPGQPGSECAGTIVAVGPGVAGLRPGDQVVALASGSFRSYVTAPAEFVAPSPPGLSPEAAVTLPIAYLTAAFALEHLGQMRRGERVLIHAAAGGVGLAAVRLAQRAGAEIFATAGSPAKRAFLRSIGVQHCFDSRSLSFADEVRAATGGEGVDLVLNALAGEFVPRSLALLRPGGRFLELGKRDHLTAGQVAALGSGIRYHVIDWGDDARARPALIRGLLLDLLAAVERGELPALPLHTFTLAEAPAAFRFMAQARHIGKVVVSQAPTRGLAVRPDAAYLITGGLSGLGLATARWLASQGARHLALMGRRGATAEGAATLAELEQAGARVLVIKGDVARAEEVSAALARIAAELPPLRGIVHAAGVLDDGAFGQQSWARFATVLAPKVDGAWQLHTQTAGLPLDFFVLYSSAAALFGSAGQANHAAANAFLDALAQRRRADGLPALSINWGAWGEVGAAVASGAVERIGAQGMGAIAPASGLQLLGRMLAGAPPQVGVVPISWPTFLGRFGAQVPPFFAECLQRPVVGAPQRGEPAQAGPDIARSLAEAPPQRRYALLRDYTRVTVGHVLGLAPNRVADEVPLSAMGLDSLMAVELRNLLGSGLRVERRLPATLAFDYPTVAAIADYLAGAVMIAEAPAAAEPVPTPSDGAAMTTLIDELEDLSDDEVDRLLAEKLRG